MKKTTQPQEKPIMYLVSKYVGDVTIESEPEQDLGFNWDSNYSYVYITGKVGDTPEYGVVKIDELIEELQRFKGMGANYVKCGWHEDHGELELTAVNNRVATAAESKAFKDSLKRNKTAVLKKQVESLKKELERANKALKLEQGKQSK